MSKVRISARLQMYYKKQQISHFVDISTYIWSL